MNYVGNFNFINQYVLSGNFWVEPDHIRTDIRTDKHINTLTWPSLGAGPSENNNKMY